MPFDSLKTHQQLFIKHGKKQDSYIEICRLIYREAGMRGFFVGWRIRYLMYLIHTSMTVDLLEKLEGIRKQLRNK
jgi:hypothetical protein